MRITCNRKELIKRLTATSRGASRAQRRDLCGFHLEAADDGTLTITTAVFSDIAVRCFGSVNVETPGVAAVGWPLTKTLREMKEAEQVSLEVKDRNLVVSPDTGSAVALHLEPLTDFTPLSRSVGYSTNPPTNEFLHAIDTTTPFASTDSYRPILEAVKFEGQDGGTKMIATDSYRMVFHETNFEVIKEGEDVMVPSTALTRFASMFPKSERKRSAMNVDVIVNDTTITLETETDFGQVQVVSKLTSGNYPKYEGLIPTEINYTFTGDAEVLSELVTDAGDAIRAYAKANKRDRSNGGRPVRFDLNADGSNVLAKASGEVLFTKPLPVDYSAKNNDAFLLSFNPDYLDEALRVLDGDTIEFRIRGNYEAVIISSSGGEDTEWKTSCLLMPVRIT